jgi:hypothetical protein
MMRVVAILVVILLLATMASAGDMGKDTHSATSPDSSYTVWLKDVPIPEIPETVIDPRPGMAYGERLALMADMGLPIAEKLRDGQTLPDARRQCLWVGGRIEPGPRNTDGRFFWAPDMRLKATFADGTVIYADSLFVLPAGDALAKLQPIRLWPRRAGWESSFDSITVRHTIGERTNNYRHLFAAFRAGELARNKLDWAQDCVAVEIERP